ncbi:hypothetical protein RIF29_17857 [Crotalaria pallida]|uniref:Non-specific lipid-transfer protein n=1 Tax=Crotalaria pallida TaxID=3830 RepID=A0AAN9IEX8_CROPI
MKNKFVALLASLIMLLVITLEPIQSFDCVQAKTNLIPCLNYLIGHGDDAPSGSCCNAIQGLKSSTPTKEDRVAACECLKAAADTFHGIKEGLVASLPKQCGVDVGFTFSKDIDCRNVP